MSVTTANRVQESPEAHPAAPLRKVKAAFLSTYVPRRCGIATFTNDLYHAVVAASGDSLGHQVVAINGPGPDRYEYPAEVTFELHRDRLDDYQRAADYVNFSDADVLCVQHEFGIFGGEGGLHLVRLLRGVRKPVVTTLHTILPDPEPHYRRGLLAAANWSNLLVCMTQHSRHLLIENYGIDPARVEVIPHGAPPLPARQPAALRKRLNLGDRHVLMTFGLLGPGKGIQTALEAVALAARKHPDITYLVVGATHPEIKRAHGEEYRMRLQRRVVELGLRERVIFYNQYISQDELSDFLRLSDIYVIPYPNLSQAVSGTLSYAMAMGCAVVSTPFLHAKEVLGDGRGILAPPGDPQALAEALLELLDSPTKIETYKSAARDYGRQIAWPQIGKAYLELFQRVQEVYEHTIRVEQAARPLVSEETVVEPVFDHMRRLTDDTGILQHALCRIPNRFHGYCTDDNARALYVAVMNQERLDEQSMGHLTSRYLGFMHFAQREDGRFHNFMNYQRQWTDDIGSNDSQGRSVWVLGASLALMPDPFDHMLAKQLFDRALPAARELTSPRARAYAMLGMAAYLQRFPEATDVRRALADHAAALAEGYRQTARDGWRWFEEVMTYANAKLPQALLAAGAMLQNREHLAVGRDALNFLTDQVLADDHFSLIGNQGWLAQGKPKPPFAQQPIDAAALVAAYHTAAWVLEDDRFLGLARKALNWFLGANDLRVALYDSGNGGCCDGLEASGASINQGAESTLACLKAISLMADPTNTRLL